MSPHGARVWLVLGGRSVGTRVGEVSSEQPKALSALRRQGDLVPLDLVQLESALDELELSPSLSSGALRLRDRRFLLF